MSQRAVITCQSVAFRYGGMPVLEDVNLTISENELIAVVGPNGGGKTTLLSLFLGQLRPSSGSVLVFGNPPVRERYRIGYMPQHARYDSQFPVSVLDVVLMGRVDRHGAGPYSSDDKVAAREALDEVGVADLAKRHFSALSGGQRQRILFARALLSGPELLLLDEPMANVDARTESKLKEILQRLNKHMTIVMVSHDLGFVSDIVQSVVCVNRQVVVHPTSAITGEVIQDIYGGPLRMVRHDQRCADDGHGASPDPTPGCQHPQAPS